MASYFVCDGCGNRVDMPKKVGHIVKREYCETCAATAEKFIAEEEALRRAIQEKFVDDRAALIAKYTGFKLPDVPT